MITTALFSSMENINSFEKDLATIVELKRLQRQVTYFCTQPLSTHKNLPKVRKTQNLL